MMKKLSCVLTTLCIMFLLNSHMYASSITLQPGAEGKDTAVDSYHSSTNYGDDETLTSRYNVEGTYTYALIEFDLSAMPTNITITSATLALYNSNNKGSSYVDAYRIITSWDESTITWNDQPEISATAIRNSGSTPEENSWVEWDITSLVEGWCTGTFANYGVELRNVTNGTYNKFHSSDYIVSMYHPYLTINYEEQQIIIPEPLSIILSCIAGCILWLKSLIKGKNRI